MADIGHTMETTGASVEAAIADGLARLGVGRDEVEVLVLGEPSRGVLGLGSREARVRLTVRMHPDAAAPAAAEAEGGAALAAEMGFAESARTTLVTLLALLDVDDASVDVRQVEPATDEDEPVVALDVRVPTDELVGPRGETLAALQHIIRLIAGRDQESRVQLVVDVNGYRARREQSLSQLAHRLAKQAVDTATTVVLEPMPPHERRVIHMALRDYPDVTTESIGEAERRKVTIIPRYR